MRDFVYGEITSIVAVNMLRKWGKLYVLVGPSGRVTESDSCRSISVLKKTVVLPFSAGKRTMLEFE